MLVLEEKGKPEYLEKNLSEQRTNKLGPHMTPSPGHIGGRRVSVLTLRQPCLVLMHTMYTDDVLMCTETERILVKVENLVNRAPAREGLAPIYGILG